MKKYDIHIENIKQKKYEKRGKTKLEDKIKSSH